MNDVNHVDPEVPDLELIAFHEAGHAVAYLMAGMTDISTMIPDGEHPGRARTESPQAADADPQQRIRLRMGSLMVEWRILNLVSPTRGSGVDRLQINQILASFDVSNEERQRIHDSLWMEMQTAFDRPDVRTTVHAIAHALLEHRCLADTALRQLAATAGLRTTLPLDTPERLS